MKKRIILPLALTLLLASCAGRNSVNTQPKLTPEQQFQLVKDRAVTATNGLALLISELETRPGVSLEKLRIWKQVHALSVALIAELEDVKVIDLSSREGIARAVDAFLAATDNLLRNDVMPIVDVKLKAEISRGVQLVRVAVQAIQVLLPAQPALGCIPDSAIEEADRRMKARGRQ